jgi:ankyrin repeat protein
MNFNTIIRISFLCSFSFITHSMDTVPTIDKISTDENTVTDVSLQKLINKNSPNMVNFIKEHARNNNIPLTPQGIGSLLKLNPEQINNTFMYNVDDDHLRPLLLSMGADINARDKDGKNCLFFTEKPEILEQLIKAGAEVNITANDYTPLSWLLTFDNDTEQRISSARVLLAHGANPDVVCAWGGSLLKRMVEERNIPVITLLCQYKANTNTKDSLKRTPLMLVVKDGIRPIIEILLQHGAHADACDQFGDYALHMAMPLSSYYDYKKTTIPDIVILLLQHGANPNRFYPHKKTMPLHRATEINDLAIIKALLQCGAEKHHLDEQGHTPFQLAKQLSRSSEILELLSVPASIPSVFISTQENQTNQNVPTQPATQSSINQSGNSTICSLQ